MPTFKNAIGNPPGGGAQPDRQNHAAAQSEVTLRSRAAIPLEGGRVLVLERLEVIKHPVQLGRREPRPDWWHP
jgi:hypothetical protein